MHATTIAPDFIIVDTTIAQISASHIVLTDLRGAPEAIFLMVRITVEVSIAVDAHGNTHGLVRVLGEESAAVSVAL